MGEGIYLMAFIYLVAGFFIGMLIAVMILTDDDNWPY